VQQMPGRDAYLDGLLGNGILRPETKPRKRSQQTPWRFAETKATHASPPIRGFSPKPGKSPLDTDCVVADAVAIERVSASEFHARRCARSATTDGQASGGARDWNGARGGEKEATATPSWLGIASWALPWRRREILRKAGEIRSRRRGQRRWRRRRMPRRRRIHGSARRGRIVRWRRVICKASPAPRAWMRSRRASAGAQ